MIIAKLGIDVSKLTPLDKKVIDIIREELKDSDGLRPDNEMIINQEILRWVNHRQTNVPWWQRLKEKLPSISGTWLYENSPVVATSVGIEWETGASYVITDDPALIPLEKFQAEAIFVRPKTSMTIKNLREWAIPTRINRLAELIAVNGGKPYIEHIGKVVADPTHPYGRRGLTVGEALELTELHNQMTAIWWSQGEVASEMQEIVKLLQTAVNEAKTKPRIQIATEHDLKGLKS